MSLSRRTRSNQDKHNPALFNTKSLESINNSTYQSERTILSAVLFVDNNTLLPAVSGATVADAQGDCILLLLSRRVGINPSRIELHRPGMSIRKTTMVNHSRKKDPIGRSPWHELEDPNPNVSNHTSFVENPIVVGRLVLIVFSIVQILKQCIH